MRCPETRTTCRVLRAMAVVASMVLSGCGQSNNKGLNGPPAEDPPARMVQRAVRGGPVKEGTDYPLATCIVSSEPLDQFDEPVVIDHGGRELRFCCNDCVDAFRRNPDPFLAKLARLGRVISDGVDNGS